jgi:serine/threonine-protein kinase
MIDIDWIKNNFPEIQNPVYLAGGGQKEVFEGLHAENGTVVLKLFKNSKDTDRILREIDASEKVPSVQIPKIYDKGAKPSHLGEVIWIREQLIRGQSIRQKLESGGKLSPDFVISLAKQILSVLLASESVRIVHRDVKPENIMIADDGVFWLLDFGLARHLDLESLTGTALVYGVGTPGYAPPEQFRNIKPEIDSRADLFGLGVTLFECLEGYNFFREDVRNLPDVLYKMENKPLPPISVQFDKSEEFNDLINAMTRAKPEHRIESISEAFKWIQEIYPES